ncbi:MAG: NAD(+) synthase, partial [Candidatus Sulfotelmatobacter sp.]
EKTIPTTSRPVADVLRIDAAKEVDRIAHMIRDVVLKQFKRKGAVVGVSGGIDSSVVAALCSYALGPDRVIALFMPETESAAENLVLGRMLTESLGIAAVTEDIAAILEGAGCYRRRDEAIRSVVPEYGEGYKCKITLPNLLANEGYAIFSVVVESPAGETKKVRLPLNAYLGILAASNFKQRTRKMIEYYHADRLNYAVAGTPNRLEYDLGFFVKGGDGAADFKPIAHLYKSQVYQLAEHLGVPEEICRRPPTTDTYSLAQSQEEFYFSMPLEQMDLCLYGKDHGIHAEEMAPIVGLTAEQVNRAYAMIDSKRKMARYLHMPPVLVGL